MPEDEPLPYLPAELYNDLQQFLMSAGRNGLLLAGRLTEATGASALRRREREAPEVEAPAETAKEPGDLEDTVRNRLIKALGKTQGWEPWTDPTSSDFGWMMKELGRLADAVIEMITPEPPDEEKAYNGEYLPQRRDLTPRERDILARVLHSIVYPFYSNVIARNDPFHNSARKAIRKYLSLEGDHQVLYDIMHVVNPRSESER